MIADDSFDPICRLVEAFTPLRRDAIQKCEDGLDPREQVIRARAVFKLDCPRDPRRPRPLRVTPNISDDGLAQLGIHHRTILTSKNESTIGWKPRRPDAKIHPANFLTVKTKLDSDVRVS
jgi:hypothetical protein